MATAADYRKWAEECFEWAREASDESVREQYASLGRVWLECAARAELQSGTLPSSVQRVMFRQCPRLPQYKTSIGTHSMSVAFQQRTFGDCAQ
jgi:hypothetical protein